MTKVVNVKDSLGDRMKTYEAVPKTRLVRRMPVIIRIDGKAFHTFARHFQRPFDSVLMDAMDKTMKYLCENIQGCVLGYKQSDEISLLLVDYNTLETGAWFDNQVQKMCSVAASMATMAFNKAFLETYFNRAYYRTNFPYAQVYHEAHNRGAMFDARVFNIPKEEVTNYFLWRQNDAVRNSVLLTGQSNFPHTRLHGKSCNQIQDMLFTERGVNWNDYPTSCKRGTCCIKGEPDERGRAKWIIDKEIPVFKGDGRSYIERLVHIDGE